MSTTEASAAPQAAAIIAREIAGTAAPAAPPAQPQPSAEEIAAAIDAAAAMMQEETGLELPPGIPLPHLVWNSTRRAPVHAHKACGTDDMPCAICKLRRERGEGGSVIDRYLKCVIYPASEKPTGTAPARQPAQKALTPTEQALQAVKAGASQIDASVMDPAAVTALLAMGRPILIAALEAKAKAEHADKAQRAEALRAAARKRYEEDCARAEEENAPYLERITELEADLEPLQAQVAELSEQIEDLRSLLKVVELPEELQEPKKKAASSHTGEGPRKEQRRDGVTYEDQAWKHSPTYQFWVAYNRRFPDARRRQADLTPMARKLGIPLKDLSEITDDNLDLVAAAFI